MCQLPTAKPSQLHLSYQAYQVKSYPAKCRIAQDDGLLFLVAKPATELPMALAKLSRYCMCSTAVWFFLGGSGTEKHKEAKHAAISMMGSWWMCERREWCECIHILVMQQKAGVQGQGVCSELACYSGLVSCIGQERSWTATVLSRQGLPFTPNLKGRMVFSKKKSIKIIGVEGNRNLRKSWKYGQAHLAKSASQCQAQGNYTDCIGSNATLQNAGVRRTMDFFSSNTIVPKSTCVHSRAFLPFFSLEIL